MEKFKIKKITDFHSKLKFIGTKQEIAWLQQLRHRPNLTWLTIVIFSTIRRKASFSSVKSIKTPRKQFSGKIYLLFRMLKYKELISIMKENLKNLWNDFMFNLKIRWKRIIFIQNSMFYIQMKMRRGIQTMKLTLKMIFLTINLIKMETI
jgi:hypothetical protein